MASEGKIAFVIAHYHVDGVISKGLVKLLGLISRGDNEVIFVSTNVRQEYLDLLPLATRVITRENIGYDFYSYKLGIEAIRNLDSFDRLIILNTSFAILEPQKLCNAIYAEPGRKADVLGLTASTEGSLHAQSYFISFARNVFTSASFRDWWSAMLPISERQKVIENYEIGMSKYFLAQGFSVDGIHRPRAGQKIRAICRAVWKVGPHYLRSSRKLNPTHFMWDYLLEEFGIVKLELLFKNPRRMNLSPLMKIVDENPSYGGVIDELQPRI
jgi:lipopolysaccharide biosynthesis protein